MALGALAAVGLLGLSPWYALLIGAALAPTDAALGSAVMSDRRVPKRIRQTLNVESGLNDGIATPVVMVALAGITAEAGLAGHSTPGRALLGLLFGAVLGIVLGGGGGLLLRADAETGLERGGVHRPALLALALLAYLVSVAVGANGFVAAFVGGIAFGASAGRGGERQVYYVEQTCGLASMVGLADLRCAGGADAGHEPLLAGRRVRRAQPDRHPHGAGRPVSAGLGHGRRAPWRSSGGSDRAGSPRWCSPSSRWRTCTRCRARSAPSSAPSA